MSKLVTVLYEVADLRAGFERARKDRGNRFTAPLVRSFNFRGFRGQDRDAEDLRHLAERLAAAREMLERLNTDDLSIRRGREIRDALHDYIDALARCHNALSRLDNGPERNTASGNIALRRTALKIAYDDALQQQRRVGARLNRLIETL